MLYPFMTFPDETEIVHSEVLHQGEQELVKVCIEKPVVGGFHSATCWLPNYHWEDVKGFSDSEISAYQRLIEKMAHVIIELARDGGFEHAADF